ncbi:MAG: sugar transferase [Bacteroidetes bacterium]|nr:sugar transferase [Bacteroidota bacterium]
MNKKLEKIFILVVDFIAIYSAGFFYFVFRVESGLFSFTIRPDFLITSYILYLYWFFIFLFVGMYKTWFAASRFDELSTLFKSSFIGIFILFFTIYIDDSLHGVSSGSRTLIFIYWGMFLTFVGSGRLLVRYVQRKLLINGFGRKNSLIIGFNSKAKEVLEQIESHRALGFDVSGFVAVEEENIGKEYKGTKVIGSTSSLIKYIDDYSIEEVIIALDKKDDNILIDILGQCSSKQVGLKIVPDLYEILAGQARTSQLYGIPLIDLMPEIMPEWEKKVKRLMDIFVSLITLIVSLPISLLSGIAIKLDSNGPSFFRQTRCGLDGKIFKIYKFRSMFEDAEEQSGPVWSQKNDPRITRVGKILRILRIDEIPQMINVLKGEMSMVGPRPERPFFVDRLASEIPYYKRRLKVRPGITGWAQIKHKYDENIEDVKVKLKYDLFYIENMSLRMDLKILFRTVFIVLLGQKHYK